MGEVLEDRRACVLTYCSRFATKESLKEIHRVLRPGGAFGMIVRGLKFLIAY